MLKKILNIFTIYKPAPFIQPLPQEKIDSVYKKMRLQMMLTIFTGYAGYYLVRKNFSLAKPYLIREWGFTPGDVGLIASALSVAYGISKFVMGNLSDRSNPRYFMATGIIISGIINLFFGTLPSVAFMTVFWFLNGWFQGMGWAPCARTLTHWFSFRERGTKFAIWNISHNVGGGIVGPISSLAILFFSSWLSIFYANGLLAISIGIIIIAFLRDTPQSVGLPPIEEYKNDYPPTVVTDREKELRSREILFKFVLNNRFLWILALANLFVYVVRYGVLDWAPTYLTAVKGASDNLSRFQFFVYEYAGIPGTLLAGWASDKYFKGKRAPISILYLIGTTIAVLVYWFNPPGNWIVDSMSLFAIGFLIYGPVMLIGVGAVDMVPKKAAGTAAGFTGLLGYVGGAVVAELGIGKIVEYIGWDGGMYVLLIASIASMGLLAIIWKKSEVKKS